MFNLSSLWFYQPQSRRSSSETVPLRAEDIDDVEHSELKQDRAHGSRHHLHSAWVYTACIICVACTIINASVSFSSNPVQPGKQVPLREVKPYVGLDKALAQLPDDDTNPYASVSLQNFAPYIAQLDRSAREPILVPSGRMNSTTSGAIFTDEREFRITSQVSTVMQFRIRDYGFEKCRLVFALPSADALAEDTDTFKSYSLGPYADRTQTLSVWRMPVEHRLDVAAPLAAVPLRGALQWTFAIDGSLAARDGIHATSDVFDCESGTLTTFEFACGDQSGRDGCAVEFWLDALNVEPLMAAFIVQSWGPIRKPH